MPANSNIRCWVVDANGKTIIERACITYLYHDSDGNRLAKIQGMDIDVPIKNLRGPLADALRYSSV